MKKKFNFITTYYDDVITEGGGDFCGRYAQSVDTIRATYCGAVLHYYRERARIEADDPRGYDRPQYFYRLCSALREVIKHNARKITGALRLAFKYSCKRDVLKCAWELLRLEYETIKIDFS